MNDISKFIHISLGGFNIANYIQLQASVFFLLVVELKHGCDLQWSMIDLIAYQ